LGAKRDGPGAVRGVGVPDELGVAQAGQRVATVGTGPEHGAGGRAVDPGGVEDGDGDVSAAGGGGDDAVVGAAARGGRGGGDAAAVVAGGVVAGAVDGGPDLLHVLPVGAGVRRAAELVDGSLEIGGGDGVGGRARG